MPGSRGGKRDYKPKRGGGKSFSRNLQPLDANGNETNTPDRWEPRKRNQDQDDDESDEGASESGSGSDSDSDSSEDGLGAVGAPKQKNKTPSEVTNPNRAGQKSIKASELGDLNHQPSRKEREAAEQKAAKDRYWKLHEAGKTDQAKADLARLAVIKERREAAAKAREAEKNAAIEEARVALERSKGIGKKA